MHCPPYCHNKEIHDECGVFGVHNHPEASTLTHLGLYALQHRGQETAGIVSSDGSSKFNVHRQSGLVADIFRQKVLKKLKGHVAIGHVRYSTTGSSVSCNAQPIVAGYWDGEIAVAHNGNITNAQKLRQDLERDGAIFNTTMDTELLIHLIARMRNCGFAEAFVESMRKFQGAFSMLGVKGDTLIIARDPRGFRPLVLGRKDDAWIVASETCAFDIIDAKYERDVEPGEVIVINNEGMTSFFPFVHMQPKLCVFEYVYVARPDSIINNQSVYRKRYKSGRALAQESPVEADLVVPIPDSSNVAALGYSHESGIPYQLGLIRSHYVGRTFIEPDQKIRDFGVKIKHNAVAPMLRDKRVILIDDSIVRGTTSRKIVKMVREQGGAKEVHVRVASPPWKHPCFFGIDTPNQEELIGSRMNVEETA
ncbi:amidophosphoribosyltransferase, partial [Candidatus Sumerlaeota bacterium]|nr:amidophosphoribosyltransferase [Candidatus Sumerlaeota bacterium]